MPRKRLVAVPFRLEDLRDRGVVAIHVAVGEVAAISMVVVVVVVLHFRERVAAVVDTVGL